MLVKPKIYVTRKLPRHIIEPFQEQFDITMWSEEKTPVPKEELLKEAAKADGLLCLLTEKVDAHVLNEMPHLKIIANMAVGYDNIDVQTAKEKGIVVTNTPDVLTETTADLTFALLMATARRIIEASTYIEEDKWGDWSPFLLAGEDIHHKTIGIVGMGRIGEAVARRARGFNMNVIYYNRTRKERAEQQIGASYVPFEQLLEQSDFVVSLLPLSRQTENIFNRDAFSKMKTSAIFINVSRGGVVDEEALYEALKAHTIKAAGLDVFKEEPISSEHPLVSLPNTVLLPHIGSASIATREKMAMLCFDNLEAFFKQGKALTPID